MNWVGFWKALTDTTEITTIVGVIIVVFLYSIIIYYFSSHTDKSQRYARHTPSILVSIGIFGTFLGIFFALVDFVYGIVSKIGYFLSVRIISSMKK